MAQAYEWDTAKAELNVAKHGVPFEFALRIFEDEEAVDFDVSRAEDGEVRRKTVGAIDGRLYIVVYTVRRDVERLISARRANAAEERRYGDRST